MRRGKLGITGASGFIGSHLLRHLIVNGERPIAFLQRGASRDSIQDLEGSYEAVSGDLLDRASLEPFVGECDRIIHLAGLNRYWAPDLTSFSDVNVEGVRNLAELCLKYGTSKLIHFSSCITRGASTFPDRLRDEDSTYNLRSLRFRYGETKTEGEDLIKGYVAERRLPAVILNPASAIGERDHGPTPIGKPIADIARGRWPIYVSGGACFIDVRDVVRGTLLALAHASPGSQYLLVGENLTNREFMARVARSAGIKPPRVWLPQPVLKSLGHVAESLADHVTGREPALTAAMGGLVGTYLYFDGRRAKRDLGFVAESCTPAIERCVKWFRETA